MPKIDVRGTPVRYDWAGTGPVVAVLLHGGGLDDARLSWSALTPRAAEHATVIAPDLPGFGDSPLGATTPSVVGYADWLVAFLDAVSVRRCLLAGLSLGAAVALRTALNVPDRVSGVLGCSPYGLDPRVPGGRLGWLAVHAPGVGALSTLVLRHSRRALAASVHAVMRSPIDDELLDEVLSLVRRPGAGAAWQAFQRDEVRWSGPRTVFGDKLAALSCPVTLLAGEHDLVNPDAVRTAAARIPRGVFHVVQGAGHWLPRDAPDAVADQLLDLVSAIDAGPQVCPSTRYAAETQGIDHPAAKEGTGR
jgi:pimeloyl-ACP methyl ester carboxylesterase